MKIRSPIFLGENEGFANFLKNENLTLRYLNMKYSVFITPLNVEYFSSGANGFVVMG